ncbi:hypothetical protein [Raineyella fluvialis]|uniref:hypothetical protein n=1 Tax=Raineyella fluvialis TaxID=2662261 RepID=UPI001E36A450|nr:hypothetical protein [Raineyella fluvialis]
MNDEVLIRLGKLLTSSEAAQLAARYADGDTLTQALHGIALARRPEIRAVLEACGVVPTNLQVAIPVLRAVQGAGSRTTDISRSGPCPATSPTTAASPPPPRTSCSRPEPR